MLRSIAPLLLEKGYVVKVFDLIDTEHSNCFNPFAYLHDDKDVMKMVNNLIKNTTPKDAQQNDPFWERSEIALDTAIILYLIHEAPPEEQTLDMVLYIWKCTARYCSMNWCYPTSSLNIAPRLKKRHENAWS